MSANDSSSVDRQKQATLILPEESFTVAPRPDWSEPEKWVWQEICAGRIADFNQRYGALDPKTPDGWSETREITPSFLETILTRDPYQKALARQGVRILGAWVRQPVDLENGSLSHQWWLEGSRIEADTNLRWLESTSAISFEKSVFIGTLKLSAAKVGGQLTMSGATFTGALDMNGLEVGSSLFDSEGATFKDVDLRSAKVGGQFSMIGATCTGRLDMGGLEVGSSLLMREGAIFKQEVLLTFAAIGGNLDVSGSHFTLLDLTETSIRNELFLGAGADTKPLWQPGSRLVLRNTVVSSIQAPHDLDAFPNDFDLAGCTYTRLGGLSAAGEGTQMASYEPEWFVKWLEKDKNYSPQPYQQLASVLRTMGHPDKANTILYKGKERERSEEKGRGHRSKWLGLSILKWTMGYGYGYRYFRSLAWVILFTSIGALVVYTTGIGKGWSLPKMLGFSFDLLLPLVKLDESHYKLLSEKISGWQYYYFYVHKLVGYILASFVAAGLSGITKK